MRNLLLLNQYRDSSRAVLKRFGWAGDHSCGAFRVPSPLSGELFVIASTDDEWEHVSVSRTNRSPNWPEMCRIKELFFNDDEMVMQLHVPSSDHVNVHPYCLHLWRPLKHDIPRPPSIAVGVKGIGPFDPKTTPPGVVLQAVREALA